MKGISGIILGAFLYFSFASSASAALVICTDFSAVFSVPTAASQQQYADCQKRQQEQAQLQKDKTCQTNLDNAGGHGVSTYGNESGLLRRVYDPVTSCTIICDIGYYPTVSNTCAPTLATMNQAITSQTVTSTQLVQQTQQSSGLTDSQVQAIVMLLQAFGADQAVVVKVEAALRGNTTLTH